VIYLYCIKVPIYKYCNSSILLNAWHYQQCYNIIYYIILQVRTYKMYRRRCRPYYYRIIRPHQVLRLTNNTYAQWTRNRPRLCVLMCKYAATKYHIISMTADWRREKGEFLHTT
jgi:hypothetical protein